MQGSLKIDDTGQNVNFRSSAWGWFILLHLLLYVPNLLVLIVCESKAINTLPGIQFFVLSAGMSLFFAALFLRRWIMVGILLPFYILIPFELFYIYYYEFPSTAGVIGTVLETNAAEASEFISFFLPLLFGAAAIFTALAITGFIVLFKNPVTTPPKLRRMILVGFLLFFIVLSAKNLYNEQFSFDLATNKTMDNLARIYPLGTVVRFGRLFNETFIAQNFNKRTATFTFNAARKHSAKKREVFVLVLGESSRYGNWSVNGYERNTSPIMKSKKHLVSFSDMAAGSPSTRLAIPILITRAGAATNELSAQEKSVLAAFKESGFTTSWLSAHPASGFYDSLVALHAKQADFSFFPSTQLENIVAGYVLDDALLKPFRDEVEHSDKDRLIVLNIQGSHYDYSNRHPENFDHFQPSLYGKNGYGNSDYSLKEEIINSYDNSVLFNDFILGEIIKSLSGQDMVSAMLFVSDHGELLFDGDSLVRGHGFGIKEDLHIPMFIWTSKEYRAAFPGKVQNLIANKDLPVSAENIFYSFLDMANIGYDVEDLSKSVSSSTYTPTKRTFITKTGKLGIYQSNTEAITGVQKRRKPE